jgi:outer membrane protein TolC
LTALAIANPNAVRAQTPVGHSPLESYIDIALKQNPDVQAARARWSQADARVDQANTGLWPHFDVSMQYMDYEGGRLIQLSKDAPPVPIAKLGTIPVWDNKVSAYWSIFNYSVWEGRKATRAYLRAYTHDVESKELAIAYSVSEAYYNYAKATELVGIRESAVKLAKENLATAEALLRAEKAQRNDVLRAEVAVASAEGDVLQARNSQNLAKTNFNNLLKRDYSESIELPDLAVKESSSPDMASSDPKAQMRTLPSFSQDVERAMRARPELSQFDDAESAMEGVRRVSASDYFPNVALYASYGFQEDKMKFDMTQDYLAAGLQLKWNLFSGFGTNAKVAENDAQIAELGFQKEAAVSGIRLELQNARLELENTHERHEIAIKQLHSAEENRRITKAQYDAGMVPLITMIDAETTLANAQSNLTVTTYDELIAESKYRKALGQK